MPAPPKPSGAEPQQQAAARSRVSFEERGQPAEEGAAHAAAGAAPVRRTSSSWKLPPRYEVRRLLGKGSYGRVCEAYDSGDRRPVAIKRVCNLFADPIDCKRILREVSIMSRLNHEHIVKLLDLPPPSDLCKFDELYMVMEVCDTDIRKLCRLEVTLTPAHTTKLLYNLLVGLNYLHSAGVYHRDLTPGNCLVNQDLTVKICDFGLSRAVNAGRPGPLPNTPRDGGDPEQPEQQVHGPIVAPTARARRTMTRHVVTRWYRAPELILLQDDYNQAIDVWSVGCIYAELLQMLEGGMPVEDRGPFFPGSSCFPLSPDRRHRNDAKFHTRGTTDQLNVIFDTLGTPTEAQIARLQREDARRHIRACPRREPRGVLARLPFAPPESLELLDGMLRFCAGDRVGVDQALDSRLFADIRDPAKETCAPALVTLAFDKEPNVSEPLLRTCFADEVGKFHTPEGGCRLL